MTSRNFNRSTPALGTLAALLAAALAGCSGSGDSDDTVAVNGDVAIAYAQRVNTLSMNPTDGATFAAGGDLIIREKSSPSAPEHNVTRAYTQGRGDVSDPEVSYDGKKVVFAMNCPTGNNAAAASAAAPAAGTSGSTRCPTAATPAAPCAASPARPPTTTSIRTTCPVAASCSHRTARPRPRPRRRWARSRTSRSTSTSASGCSTCTRWTTTAARSRRSRATRATTATRWCAPTATSCSRVGSTWARRTASRCSRSSPTAPTCSCSMAR